MVDSAQAYYYVRNHFLEIMLLKYLQRLLPFFGCAVKIRMLVSLPAFIAKPHPIINRGGKGTGPESKREDCNY